MIEFIEHSIGVYDNLFPQAAELIKSIENRPEWKEAIYNNEINKELRKCTSFFLTELSKTDATLTNWDTEVFNAFGKGVAAYAKNFKFLSVEGDEGYIIMRYNEGDFITEHPDQARLKPSVSGLIYLNDGFEGGNLVFPRLNISIKPKAGTGVFFPSSWAYSHAVEPITSGVRYSIATLFSGSSLTRPKGE